MTGKAKSYLIPAAALLLLVIAWGGFSYYYPVDPGEEVVSIIIEPGTSFRTVVDELVTRGVVKSRVMLLYPAQLLGVDRHLAPGKYDFPGENSCHSVLQKFRNADFVRIKLTIPEGATIWKVASILSAKMDIDSLQVTDLARDSVWLDNLNLPCLEGYLFPETYFFPWGTSARDACFEMVRMYRTMTDSIWPDTLSIESSRSHGGDLTRHDIVILASIVEAETGLDSERRTVASVYCNRLARGMKLDADPTVIYGLGGLERPLNRRDLKKDTPYNTYLHRNLPPTPINSPGLASLKAVLDPEETDYLYFVADNSGGHQFSRTNAEHNRARKKIKTERNRSD